MADSITFKTGALTSSNMSSTAQSNQTKLSFSAATGTLIYCNAPENFTSAHLGDNGKFLNQVTVSTTNAQVYASYIKGSSLDSENVYFGVQIYNPNSSSITVCKQNNGYNTGNQKTDAVQLGAYTNFFNNNPNTSYTVGSKKAVWLMSGIEMDKRYFEALMRFTTTGTCIVTVYAYMNMSNIDGYATACDYYRNSAGDVTEYSGKGNTYFLLTSISLPSKTLLSSTNQSKYYWLADCSANNTNEMVSIEMCQGGSAFCAADDASNIGNYGVQYYFTVTLRNNSSGKKIKFVASMGSNGDSSFPLLQSGSATAGKWMQGAKTWEFYESETLEYGNSKTIAFQFMPGSQACAATFMRWQAVEV